MSKYAQLPRDTLTLLAHRLHKGMSSKEYVDWAGNALVDGFDSPSLEILAGLEYDIVSQNEAPDYFIKAVKELALPIPDCELAVENWEQTENVYRHLGLSLPGRWVMVGQHLDELAEQIKEGVLDPLVGLERIYVEVVSTYYYDWGGIRSDGKDWDGEGVQAWDELWDYIHYDDHGEPYKELETEQIDQEIRTFAADWLKDKKVKFAPNLAIREKLPESERRKFMPVVPIEPKPTPSIQSHEIPVVQIPVSVTAAPKKEELESRKLNTIHVPKPRNQGSFDGRVIRLTIIWILSPIFIVGIFKFRDLPLGILIVALILGLAAIALLADYVAKTLGGDKRN